MALTYTKELLGTMTIVQNNHKFKIQIRKANCLAVFIHERIDGEEITHTLYSFFSNEQHLKNLIEYDKKPFYDEVKNIKLNMKYKECETLLKHLVKFYNITAYYK